MTLAELTSYVSVKTQNIQPNDLAAIQQFLSKRYELIYNSELWKDSLAIIPLQFDPVNNPDNTSGVLSLPQQVDRVVAVRTNCNSVRVNNLENYYRVDYDAFTANNGNMWGAAREFSILYPIWAALAPTTNNPFVDQPNPGSYTTNAGGGLGTLNVTIPAGSIFKLVAGPNERGIVGGQVLVPGTTYILQATFTSNTTVIGGTFNAPFSGSLSFLSLAPSTVSYGPGATVFIQSSAPTDGAKNIKVIWRDRKERFVQTLPLPVTLTPSDGSGFVEIEAIFKPVTDGTLSVYINNSIPIATTSGPGTANIFTITGLTLGPAVLTSPKYSRIRLFGIPSVVMNIYVLCKKPFVPLDFPSETPLIKNLDNCLIAFATAEMLERDRQYAKAQAKNSEAVTLLKELSSLEAVQAANHEQFKPDNGYGERLTGPNSTYGYLLY